MAVSKQLIERNQRLRRWLRRMVFGVLGVMVLAIGYAFYVQIDTVLGLQREHAQLQQELLTVQEKNNGLAQELLLKDDPAYLEFLARKWLGLIKPGETKVILPPSGN